MPANAEALLRAALALPVDERATMAAQLLESLDPPGEVDDPQAVEAAWAEEIAVRAERAVSGADPGVPWSEVSEQIRRRLGR